MVSFPVPGSSYRGPAPEFAGFRASSPVVRLPANGGGHCWIATTQDAVRVVLDDVRFSRAASYEPAAPTFPGLFQAPPGMIISLDPPAHTRLRDLVSQAFSADRIESMRPRIEQLVAALLDQADEEALEGPVDLLGKFTFPLAIIAISDLLGVPAGDRDTFARLIREFAAVDAPELAAAAGEQLGEFMAGLVFGKMAAPGDDVLSALTEARIGDDKLEVGELIGLGYTLLGAGGDSTACHLASSVLTLLGHHRDTWVRLGERPEEVPAAVEELLRWITLSTNDTTGLPRIATEDVTLFGVTIPKGDAVFVSTNSANRDETLFTDPDALDFTRTDNAHLAFGYGIHRCLGAPLARIELTTAFEELTRRFPAARLAVAEEDLQWQQADMNHRLVALPVDLHGKGF
ncbi:cytochrome P450 [Lentzea flaviverrucosa]|uniref:Nocardicin N-oxygenase n=1 Tax=Lentzea flaviverrucosa TaxID=200379 RepID=A0A1H9XMI4_9PSEU|nr:cytochrome P450 [Lentzea flaviverrucosa]RDI20384.1 nocardicin N-oxygenase [Lentzea flaviverrucosa]SES46873.1 nocardicin N-oxygenase [Lentzea flaviverrucosa]